MTTDTVAILLTCFAWCNGHITKYPTLTQDDVHTLYVSPGIHAAQDALHAAASTGDVSATEQAAHTWCAAWRDALKHVASTYTKNH